MRGIRKSIIGLIIIGIGLGSILTITPIILTLDNPEHEINDDDSNPNEIINNDDPEPQDPEPQDPEPQDPEPQDPEPQDPEPQDPEPMKGDDGPGKDDDGPGKDDDDPKDQIISAISDFCPKTLNLKSKGKWVTVYIELQEGYNVNNIDIDKISLDGLYRVESSPTEIGNYDEDEFLDLMVKFDRQDVIGIVDLDENEEIPITGKLYDGTAFEGTCIIIVINP